MVTYERRRRAMKQEKYRFTGIRAWLIALFLAFGFSTTGTAQQAIELSDQEVENLVRRSYQYVAMFNVIQKFALDPASAGLFTDGFNRPVAATALADHTMKSIPRPNNDTLYQISPLSSVRSGHNDPSPGRRRRAAKDRAP